MAYTYVLPDGVVDDGVVRSTAGTNVTAVFQLPDIPTANSNLGGQPTRVVSSLSINGGVYNSYSWVNSSTTLTLSGNTQVAFRGFDDGTPTTVSMYTDSGSTFIRYYYGICGSLEWYTVPTAPQTITATRTGTDLTTITVTVTSGVASDGGSTLSRYVSQIDSGFGFTNAKTITSVGGSSTYTGVNPTASQQIRVYAENAAGYSQATTVTVPAVPAYPTSVAAASSATVEGSIDLSWTAATPLNGTIIGYEIYKDGSLLTTTSGSGVTYTDAGNTVESSHSYYFRTKVDSSGTTRYSAPSAITSPATAPGVPGAPVLVSVDPSTETPGVVTLNWTAPVVTYGGVVDYLVYVDGAVYATVVDLTATLTGLNYNQLYSFSVRARNAWAISNSTYGALSNITNATAPGEEVLPLSAFFNKSLRVIPSSASNDTYAAPTGDLAAGVFRYDMVAGETYTVLATCRLAAAQTGTLHEFARKIVVVQNGGTVVASSSAAPNTAGATQLRLTFTLPADATAATIRLYNGASLSAGDVWWDQFAVIEGTYTDAYFDGSSTDLWPNTYAWSSTENASTSTKVVDMVNSVVNQPITAPYGQAGRADSQAMLKIKYRSGWVG